MQPWRELGTFGSQDKCLNPKTNWDLYRRSSIGSTPAGTKLFKLVWKYFVSGVEMLHLWCGNVLFSFLSYKTVGTKSFQQRGKKIWHQRRKMSTSETYYFYTSLESFRFRSYSTIETKNVHNRTKNIENILMQRWKSSLNSEKYSCSEKKNYTRNICCNYNNFYHTS